MADGRDHTTRPARAGVLDSSLYERQLEMELDAVDEGGRRYRRLARRAVQRGEGAALKPVERLLAACFTGLTRLIRREQEAIRDGDPAPQRNQYGPALVLLAPVKIAVLALHEIFSQCLARPAQVEVPRLAEDIGRAVNAEVNLPAVRRDPDAWKELTHTSRHRLTPKMIQRIAKRHYDDAHWGRRIHVQIGALLISCIRKVARVEPAAEPVFVIFEIRGNREIRRYLRLSAPAMKQIDRGHELRQFLRPRFAPMVVPPVEDQTGQAGYIRLRPGLMKRPSRRQGLLMKAADLTATRRAVNILSRTAWRVNPFIYGVARQLWDAGGNYAGTPRRYDRQIPPIPLDFHDSRAAKRQWKDEASAIHRANAQTLSERVTFTRRLDIAEQLLDAPAIYLPHQLDFRGRAYPVPLFLHQQGDDLCRGLLEFAAERPLDSTARRWLAVHLANCCGIDHLAFADRIGWVEANQRNLSAWADDPLEATGWMEVDKPFQALAAARQYTDGSTKSRLPIQVDGTCNGLQHYAALGRDPAGAAVVNLRPADEPEDLYQTVCEAVIDRVQMEAMNNRMLPEIRAKAAEILPFICRKLVKRPVMTSVYGVTRVGARNQVYEELIKTDLADDRVYDLADYIAKIIMDAVSVICPAARAIMDWMQSCAAQVAKAGDMLEWVTPLGLPIVQAYRRTSYMRVRTCLQWITLARTNTGPIHIRRQTNGFPPNFIHSMDATHMLMAALAAEEAGISFAAVHDGFWTHPVDMPILRDILREQFAALYAAPSRLRELRNQISGRLAEPLPEPPPPGDWDVTEILQSEYAFS